MPLETAREVRQQPGWIGHNTKILTMSEMSLYERLRGYDAVAAVAAALMVRITYPLVRSVKLTAVSKRETAARQPAQKVSDFGLLVIPV